MFSRSTVLAVFSLFSLLFCFSAYASTDVSVGDENSRFPFFLDVSPDDKAFDAITYLYTHEMVNGYSDNTFAPGNEISRVEAVKLLLGASKKSLFTAGNQYVYSDVLPSKWYTDYIYTAKKMGVINPLGEAGSGKFNPTRRVNRAELIKMIIEINGVSVRSLQEGEEWFAPYFDAANELHLFNTVYSDAERTRLYSYAGDVLTRGEVALYMYRYLLNTANIFGKSNGVNSNVLSADLSGKLSPLHVNALFAEGKMKLQWNANSFEVFEIVVSQRKKNGQLVTKSLTVKGGTLQFETDFFQNFEIGLVQFRITQDSSERARFILPLYTKFTPYVSNDFVINYDATTYQYGFPNKKISVEITLKNSESTENLSLYKAYVLNSSEKMYEKSLIVRNEKSLVVEFIPQVRDLYIIEISDASGLAKAVVPVTPYGFFPILPNNMDILEYSAKNTDVVNANTSQIIQLINILRKSKNIPLLKEKVELNSLAQVRVRDMKERNYLSHYTPEGLSVNDMRSDYGLTSSLAENLATHSRGAAFATLGLEYSPTHRKTLLNPDLEFVGVASAVLENGEVLLVEVFQNTVLNQSDIETGTLDLYNYISEKFPDKNTEIILQNASEDWSKIMGEKEGAQTDFSTGESWKNILDTYNITKSVGIFVLSHQSPKKMKEYFEENPAILSDFFQQKSSYGLSLVVSKSGIVYLTIIGSE